MSAQTVDTSVHERLDSPGFVVRIRHGERLQKLPTDTFQEAEEFAKSIRDFVQAGLPVAALFGEEEGP